jgi:hypothetical protein
MSKRLIYKFWRFKEGHCFNPSKGDPIFGTFTSFRADLFYFNPTDSGEAFDDSEDSSAWNNRFFKGDPLAVLIDEGLSML